LIYLLSVTSHTPAIVTSRTPVVADAFVIQGGTLKSGTYILHVDRGI